MAEELIIRKAESRDMRRIFVLSNDPLVRANSIHSEPIRWEDHEKWFANALRKPSLKFFIAENADGELVGQVRFERRDDFDLVSISVAAPFRGKGMAQAMLQSAMNASGGTRFVAEIREDNASSLALFARCGFALQTDRAFESNGHVFKRLTRDLV